MLNWQVVLLNLFSVVFHNVDCGGGEGRGTEDLNYILLYIRENEEFWKKKRYQKSEN